MPVNTDPSFSATAWEASVTKTLFLTKCFSDREVRGSCFQNLSIFSFNEWISSKSWHNVFNDCSEERVGLKEKFTALNLHVNVKMEKKIN